ncbi:MAG: hypothetical protein FJ037_03610 [Chloroflexi bacterium]|nr:hypothetical protein [Chloroflexota bacterium]
MRLIPVEATPLLAGNSSTPAAVVTGMTTAAVTAVAVTMPALTNISLSDFTIAQTPPPAVVAAAPHPTRLSQR